MWGQTLHSVNYITISCRAEHCIESVSYSIVCWHHKKPVRSMNWQSPFSAFSPRVSSTTLDSASSTDSSPEQKPSGNMNWGLRRWVMTSDDQQLLTGSWKLAKFISDNKNSQWEVSRNWGELRSIYRIISPPSSREAVAKFRVSPPGQLPVLWSHGRED